MAFKQRAALDRSDRMYKDAARKREIDEAALSNRPGGLQWALGTQEAGLKKRAADAHRNDLHQLNDFIEAGNNFLPVKKQQETAEAIKDCIYNLLDVSVNSSKFEILSDTLINLTDEKTFKAFKEHIKSFETKSAKIKMYQAVKFENNKAKYIQADTSEAFKNQLKTA